MTSPRTLLLAALKDRSVADAVGVEGVLAALGLRYDGFGFACSDGRSPEPVPYAVSRRKFILEDEATLAGRA